MTSTSETGQSASRGRFSSRKVFILAAIGSAVGLGNIWRFPATAYDNGGGAFMIPYLVALFVAGIPFLLLDYAMGHRYQGSPPLTFARFNRGSEALGWWQVGVCWFISIYYAIIMVWACLYLWYSLGKDWEAGGDSAAFFHDEVLRLAEKPGVTFDFVPHSTILLVLVWAALIAILALGVQKGVGMTSVIFIPLLVVAFALLVIRAIFLDGAATGLDALFTPDWSALTEAGVWSAAFGQIFFSLSIGFGIMITYASYVKRKENLSGSAFVIGLSNSGFEILAGIGVFSALGFIAQANGIAVGSAEMNEALPTGGTGLAFVTFPTIVSQAPLGTLMGLLFFASLVMAGFTSMISISEVVVSSFRDKFDLGRVPATLITTLPTALVSILLFGTTSALYVLDVIDHFINQFGILLAAVVSIVVIAWAGRKLPVLARHLNAYGSVRVSTWWYAAIGVLAPLMLGYGLVMGFKDDLNEAYGGYPQSMLLILGWGVALAAIVFGLAMAAIPWSRAVRLTERPPEAMFSEDWEERITVTDEIVIRDDAIDERGPR